jgi:uncharacterized protein
MKLLPTIKNMGKLLGAMMIFSILSAPLLSGTASFDVKANYNKFEFRIPMRDGKRLFTAVYVPKDTSKTYPFLIDRTPYSVAPYGVNHYPEELYPGEEFERDGFIFVYQDVRGRYMSEGTWEEMTPERAQHKGPADVDESTDTYDTIEWLLHNVTPNNGKAGLVGISYPGFYTSAGMIDAHPALVAASPQAPVSDLYMGDDAFHNGAFFLAANFSFYAEFRKQDHPVKKDDHDFNYGTEDGYKFYLNMGSVQNANERYFKYANPYWNQMIEHPNYDSFWKERNILPHLQNIKPAVLVVGGWFDAEDLAGTLKTFRTIQENSPQTPVWLAMGPWFHGGWARSTGASLGDINFGSNTAEYFRQHIQFPFFEHYLKDGPDPKLSPINVFETGANKWREYSQWPPKEEKTEKWFLHANGKLSTNEPKPDEGADEYTSDPNKPVPFYDRIALGMERAYMDGDQRFASRRTDVLTYTSDPLEQDVTVTGPVSPTLHVATTGTDSDFVVKLVDVYPDDYPQPNTNKDAPKLGGYQQLVRGEPFRGKFRHSFEQPEPFTPGKVETIQFSMPDINHCFRRGHRIMVQVQSSWFPLVDRNPQVFTNIPTAKQTDFQKAVETVYHSSADPSFVQMNVSQ